MNGNDSERKQVQFINETDLEFNDILSEEFREYFYREKCYCRIEKPAKLHVSKSGGHRVFAQNGDCYYVFTDRPAYIRWRPKEKAPHFVR